MFVLFLCANIDNSSWLKKNKIRSITAETLFDMVKL